MPADLAEAEGDREGLHLWRLGGGFLLSHDGVRVAVNVTGVRPDGLPRVDVVAISHAGSLDTDLLGPLFAEPDHPSIVAPEALRAAAAECAGIDEHILVGIDAGQTREAGGVRMAAVPALRGTGATDPRSSLGFVIALGPWRVWHTGGTRIYAGLDELLLPHALDLALIGLGEHGLEPAAAARLAASVGVGLAVPYAATGEDAAVDDFERECGVLGQAAAAIPLAGRLTLAG